MACAIAVAGYVALSATAARPITPAERGRFSRAILVAGVLHVEETGGPRAAAYAAQALRSPVRTHRMLVHGREQEIALPPCTFRRATRTRS
jgi:hypothetical protein